MVLPCAAGGFWAAEGLQLSILILNDHFSVRGRNLARTAEHLFTLFLRTVVLYLVVNILYKLKNVSCEYACLNG